MGWEGAEGRGCGGTRPGGREHGLCVSCYNVHTMSGEVGVLSLQFGNLWVPQSDTVLT